MRTPSASTSDLDIGVREGQGMAERDQVGRPLGRQHAGDARDAQRIAFGIIGQGVEHVAAHADEGVGARRAAGFRLAADVDHSRLARRIEM